jgi:hypothetical protein
LLRRIEKIATVLSHLDKKKQLDLRNTTNQQQTRSTPQRETVNVSNVFERTVASERRRLAKIEKNREKVIQVKNKDNQILIKKRRSYQKKITIEKKRQEVVQRRVNIQKRHLKQRAKKRERESKRTRELVQKKHEDTLLLAAENLRIKNIEAVEKKRLYDLAKKKENNKSDLVAQKRKEIKERARIVVEKRRDEADRIARESKERLHRIATERDDRRAATRELQKLHKRDREEMVRRQRQARLHEQDTAQASHAKWLQRGALLNEIETAVRNERQRHAKEFRIHESRRRAEMKYERDILPGPGEYSLSDPWTDGKGRGATKISDANPKSDVDWAIHRAKNLPGPGAVRCVAMLLVYCYVIVVVLCCSFLCRFFFFICELISLTFYLLSSLLINPFTRIIIDTQYEVKSRPSTTGVNFTGKKPKSDVDWMIHRASMIPGPGQYTPAPVAKRGSLKFSEFTPKSEIDKVIMRSQDVPSPQDYAKKDLRPVRQKNLNDLKSHLNSSINVVLFASKLKGRANRSRAAAAAKRKLHQTL